MHSTDEDSVVGKTIKSLPLQASFANSAPFRLAEMGGSNGFGNARGIGRIMSMVSLGGTIGGKRFLSPETVDLIFQEQAHGVDLVIGRPLKFGIGFGLPEKEDMPFIREGRSCYWSGWGGSI